MNIRELLETLRNIEEAGYLLGPRPGRAYGMRNPKYSPEEYDHAAKFAVDMALQNNGGKKEDVLSWLAAHIAPLQPEIEAKVRALVGAPVSEGDGYTVGDPHPSSSANVPANSTRLNLEGVDGLQINRLIRALEQMGYYQTEHYFIKSGHPSWMKNEILDFPVLDLLHKYGVEEDEQGGEIDESAGILETMAGVEKAATAYALKNQKSGDWAEGAMWVIDYLKQGN